MSFVAHDESTLKTVSELTAEQVWCEKIFQEFVDKGEMARNFLIQAIIEEANGSLSKMPGNLKFIPMGTEKAKNLTDKTLLTYMDDVISCSLVCDYMYDGEDFTNALMSLSFYCNTTSEIAINKKIPEATKLYDWLIKTQSRSHHDPRSTEKIEHDRRVFADMRQTFMRLAGDKSSSKQNDERKPDQTIVPPPGFSVRYAAYRANLPENRPTSIQENAVKSTSPVQPDSPISKDVSRDDTQNTQSKPHRISYESRTPEMLRREDEALAILKRKLKDPFHASDSGTKENKTPRRW